MRAITKSLVNFLKQEDGPTAVEYAVMLFLSCISAAKGCQKSSNTGIQSRLPSEIHPVHLPFAQ